MMTESVPLSRLSIVPSHVHGVYLHAVVSCLWSYGCLSLSFRPVIRMAKALHYPPPGFVVG